MMSPAREHGIAETPRLVEQTFEETQAATHGLVMVDFWADLEATEGRVVLLKVNVDDGTLVDQVVGAAPKTVLQSTVSTRAS